MQPSDRPLLLPHLPQQPVTAVAISAEAGESRHQLTAMGIRCLPVPPHPRLPAGIRCHADLQMFHMGTSAIYAVEQLFGPLKTEGFQPQQIDEPLGGRYPTDVPLNAIRLGRRLICNPKTISRTILQQAETLDLEIIPTAQGYSKCAICCLREDLLITDDPSIAKSAQFFCSDLLIVSKGSIRLEGYDYGFIGGCCGMLDRDLIAWNGRVETHSDAKAILHFLQRHQIKSINLNDGPLTDIGSIVPLREQNKSSVSI